MCWQPLPGLGILRSYFLITLAEGWLAYLLSRVDKSGHPSLTTNHIAFQWRALAAMLFDWFGAWTTMHPLWWLGLCFAATGVRAVSSMVRTEYVRRTQGSVNWALPGLVRHPVLLIVGVSAAAHSVFWGGFTASVREIALLPCVLGDTRGLMWCGGFFPSPGPTPPVVRRVGAPDGGARHSAE